MIWLIDYTHYHKTIDPRLVCCKNDYHRLKSYVRYHKIGMTAPVGSRIFGTGLLRLATILQRNGIDVKYLHYDMLEELLEKGEALPEKIAFSSICPTVPHCAALARKIKERSPKTKTVIGGVHVTLALEKTKARYPDFDIYATGYELEAAEKIAERPLAPVPEPYADYSLLPYPLTEYAINTLTSMGCPFRCDYCSDGKAPAFCAAKDGQVGIMKTLLPERTLVHFFDSVLGHSQGGIHRVCEVLKAADHKFLLSCDMRADLLTPSLLKEMEEAGFVEIRLGMESADPELLQRNNRTLTPDRFTQQIRMIRENSKLYIALYTITGLPGTTKESHEKTLAYCDYLLREHLVDEIKNGFYVPYPMDGLDYGSRGITVHNEDWSCYDRQSYPVFSTPEMSADDLWALYLETAQRINQSWLAANGFDSFDAIPIIEGYYHEYVQSNYIDNKKT